jgi:hypothetical protein
MDQPASSNRPRNATIAILLVFGAWLFLPVAAPKIGIVRAWFDYAPLAVAIAAALYLVIANPPRNRAALLVSASAIAIALYGIARWYTVL